MKKVLAILMLLISYVQIGFAVDLELTQGLNKALPIALIPFNHQNVKAANIISETIKKDLVTSGRFRFVAYDDDLQSPENVLQTDFSYWKLKGVNYLIVGSVATLPDKKWSVNFQLLDPVTKAHLMLSQSYKVDPKEARSLAHHISDLVYEQLTGEKGIFSTRIAYVVLKREKDKPPRYTLEIADYDGHEAETLLISSEPLMSPAWSPDGNRLAYVSFENKRSEVYVVNIETGERQRISSFPGINGAPKWSPNGKKLALVLSKSGEPKIYLYDFSSKKLTQLTHGMSIDTEPSFSPDGKRILFTSNRGGSPQLYELRLADLKVKRLTFEGDYNSSGAYSPVKDKVFLLHRSGHDFSVAVQSLKTGELTPLTFSKFDESPTVSPNGNFVLYSTQSKGRGVLRIVSIDGKVRLELPHKKGDVQNPAWSPQKAQS